MEWTPEKKQAFVTRMGKKRASFARGGVVRRKRFAAGGTTLTGPQLSGDAISGDTTGHGIGATIANFLGVQNSYVPNAAPIQAGTNVGQLQTGYEGAQGAIQQQQGLATQFAPLGPEAVQTEQGLTGQLQGIASGQGPNPAQAALAENTRRNIATQAALAANQRGANTNVGLIARQAAQQGADTQQQAVGEAATMQAQQQIAAQQQLQNLAAQEAGQQVGAVQGVSNAQQNEQNILQGANTSLNNANVAMQSNINSVEGQTAAGNQQASSNTIGGVAAGVGAAAAFLDKGGPVPHLAGGGKPLIVDPIRGPGTVGPGNGNNQEVGPWLNSNAQASSPNVSGPAAVPSSPDSKGQLEKGIGSAVGNTIGALKGSPAQLDMTSITAPEMTAGNNFSESAVGDLGSEVFAAKGGRITPGPHRSHVANYLASGGRVGEKVPAMVSPDEVYLSPEKVRQVVEEGANPMKIGYRVPGKAKKKNDSLKNDTVPMTLEEGGVVIPRHITTHKMAPEKAELFVHRANARKKAKSH